MPYKIDPRLLRETYLRRCTLPKCQAACCRYGTWVDLEQVKLILANVNIVKEYLSVKNNGNQWFTNEIEPDEHVPSGQVTHTVVTNRAMQDHSNACVFLREDFKCALQIAAESNHLYPWVWKPFYCVIHPLEIDKGNLITVPDNQTILNEKASCLQRSETRVRLIDTLLPEMQFLLGKDEVERIRKTPESDQALKVYRRS